MAAQQGWQVRMLAAFAALAWSSAAAPAQDAKPSDFQTLRIGRIETAGHVTVTREQILAAVRARVGELFVAASAEDDIKRIAKIEGVESAYYNTAVEDGAVRLTFVVIEKNLVREIAFIGNRGLPDSRLVGELGFKKGDYLDTILAESAVETLTQAYRKKGFVSAKVELNRAKLPLGRVEYVIDEGARTKVAAIRFRGNNQLPTSDLRKVLKTKKRTLFLWPADLDSDLVDKDIVRLQEAYQRKAFLNAGITSQVEFSPDKKKAYVTFVVDEGPPYIVNQIALHGNTFLDEQILRQDLKLRTDWYYTDGRAESDAKKIQGHYLAQGFVDAVVEYRRAFLDQGRVNVDFDIVEGQRYRIGRIDVAGNQTFKDNVIRRILDEEGFRPGQWYDADIARGDGKGDLETVVRRTALSESVKITPLPARPGSEYRDVQVNIVESQTGAVRWGAGVGSDVGVVGQLSYDQRNFDISDYPKSLSELIYGGAFKGAGQHFQAAIYPGTIQSTFHVSLIEPYLFDKPQSLEVAGSGFQRWRESYDEERLKAYIGFTRRYENDWRRGIGLRAENVDVSDLEKYAPREVRRAKGGNNLVGISFFIEKDTTDNRYTPSKGYNFSSSYEQVGGDWSFAVLEATQRWYYTLYEDLVERKTVLETKVHGATIAGGSAPVFEKFYGGGIGSIRGFDYRGVSPRGLQYNPVAPPVTPRRKDPIGSDWILTANAEVVMPLNSEVISALFFVDTGTIETGGIRAAVGTGIQILLPQWFGPTPMRFEIAYPFMKDSDDETRTFSFSVGSLF